MIRNGRVFVLGAGASFPYGFPTGSELTEFVLQHIEQKTTAYYTLQDIGFGPSLIETFAAELRNSGKYSVDAFLEHRKEFLDVGKAIMAIHLIGCENPPMLWQLQNSRGDWYRYLAHHLTEACSPDRFAKNEVAFISFNYDRSLETYLFSALKNSFGLSDEATRDLMSAIPILHLHGDLGPLPWQGAPSRPYSQDLSRDAIDLARSRIRIVHDQSEDKDQKFNLARNWINKADTVALLGFGFAKPNVTRLGLAQMGRTKGVATAIGMGEAEIWRARQLVKSWVQFQNLNCLELLRQNPQII